MSKKIEIAELAKISLGPEDRLLVRVPEDTPFGELARAKQLMDKTFGEGVCLVFAGNIEFTKVEKNNG